MLGNATDGAPGERLPADPPVVIIGAGPAGLTAAHELTRLKRPAVVFERDSTVGGLARTVVYKGFRFDIGGHRFFTKSRAVQNLWRDTLGVDFLTRPRLSRIYYAGRFFDYPIRAANALRGLGLFTTISVVASYIYARLQPIHPETSFADWVTNRFGRKLYQLFFETYPYKVWGIPPSKIDARWAAQRIKGLSLSSAAWHMLRDMVGISSHGRAKTLIDKFEYPRLGPGMMWERLGDRATQGGTSIVLDAPIVSIHHDRSRVTAVEISRGGVVSRVPASAVISTMPLRELVHALHPSAPADVRAAADRLTYRDFLTVAVVVNAPALFPDNWIYVHDAHVRVGRIQNFKNWSPEMVPDDSKTCLGLEYFCFVQDDLWVMSDYDLIALASRELQTLGLLNGAEVVDGVVVRVPKAYPVYDEGYQRALDTVRAHLETLGNLQVVGRNGMHKYNNQDHSMLTAMLAVRNLAGERHDIWAVNADDDYHESVESDTLRQQLTISELTQPLVPRVSPRGSED